MSSSAGRRVPTQDEGGSAAPFGRRVLALLVDWIACLVITHGLVGRVVELSPEGFSFVPLGLLFVLNTLGVTLGGATFGHRLLGLRVVPVHGQWVTPLRSTVRAALLCLFIPAIIMLKDDGRGLHDLAAGTRVTRP